MPLEVMAMGLALARGTEVRELRETVKRQQDKLLELAKQCAECSGTGCVDVLHRGLNNRLHSVSEDCPACLDIRELLR